MFKLIILHKNNTYMICQNDGEGAKSISWTKRYIFIKVNLNVFSVEIKSYRIYVANLVFTFSFYKYKNHFEFPRVVRSPWLKIWKFLGGGGGHRRPPGTENPGGWGGANQNVFRGGGGMDISGTTHWENVILVMLEMFITLNFILFLKKSMTWSPLTN